MMVQTKCKLNTDNAEFFPRTIFRAKKLETKSTTWKHENSTNGKVRFRLNIEVRKEKEDSWLNAIKTKIAFVKGRLNISNLVPRDSLFSSSLGRWNKDPGRGWSRDHPESGW